MGVALYNIRDFDLNGTVTLVSNVGLSNWNLKTQTALKSLVWKEHPTMTLFGQKVPVTSVVSPAIALFKSVIEDNIDSAIATSLDFKPSVLDALEQISTPFQMSDTYESWLRVVPAELYTTDAKLTKSNISFQMGLKCVLETVVGYEPKRKFDRNKIILKPVKEMPERVTATIVAVSTYEDASRIMTKNFNGYTFSSGSKKVTVSNVKIWQKSNKMIIALDLQGSIAGTIYLSGYPQYNEVTQEVFFDQLDYVLDTKNVLTKSANWMASNYILKQLQEQCRYSIAPNLEEGKENIKKYITNYSPTEGVYINGKLGELAFKKVQLTPQAMLAFITVDGMLEVKVNGL